MEQYLITNEETRNFFNVIKENLSSCHEFKICVSFIRISGAQLLVDILKELDKQDIKGQILTSTYMNVTQPDALEMLSSFKNIQLKIFTPNYENGFHAKGYLFLNPENNDKEKWTIIVGSSNISGAAFKKNVEWNILNHEPLLENNEPSEFSKSILEEFDKVIGIEKIGCVHINDSKNDKGAHKDRHENIGCGMIGFDNLLKVIYHEKLEKEAEEGLENLYNKAKKL